MARSRDNDAAPAFTRPSSQATEVTRGTETDRLCSRRRLSPPFLHPDTLLVYFASEVLDVPVSSQRSLAPWRRQPAPNCGTAPEGFFHGCDASALLSSRQRSRRSGALSGSPLAAHRPVPRRTRFGCQRRSKRARALLLWKREWRRLGEPRCRPHLEPDLRRPADRFHRRARRSTLEPEDRLRRDRRSRHALRHCTGRRHVQVVGRRQELEAYRPRRFPTDRKDRRPPRQTRPHLRRGSRPSLRTELRARPLSLARRRSELAEDPCAQQR